MLGLLRPLLPVLAIQIYWASIVFIGWILTAALLKRTKGSFIYNWKALPFAARFFIATSLGFSLFGVFTLIGYGLSLSAWWLVGFYLAAVLWAVIYAYRNYRVLIKPAIRPLLTSIQSLRLFSPLGILLILSAVSLVLTFFIGGFIGADGFIHVSKIRHLVDQGFTFTDAYYGTVPETRHTLSILHTILAVPSRLSINPITSWYASAMFLQLVKLAGIFYLAWRLLYWTRSNVRSQYAALATIITLGLFNNYFISYPSVFVGSWIILLTIALFDITERHNHTLLIVASFLIALTHPLASLACAFLIALIGLGFLIFDRTFISKKNIFTFGASFVLLLSTPLFTSTLPDRMTDYAKNFAAGTLQYLHIGRFEAFRPASTQYFVSDSFSIAPWPIALLSVIGIVGMFIFIKNRRHRILIGAFMLFVPLLLYNPLTFTFLKKFLPIWGIARFIVVNQLIMLTVFFGILFVVKLTDKLIKSRYAVNFVLPALTVLTLIIFLTMQTFGAIDPVSARHASMYEQQKMVYGNLSSIIHVLPEEKNATVLAELSWDSFIIPVVAPLHVVAINEANSPPAADMVDRSACFTKLYSTLNPGLLKQAQVDYILVRRSESALYNIAIQTASLTPVKQDDERVLFKFDSTSIQSANEQVCTFVES